MASEGRNKREMEERWERMLELISKLSVSP